MTLSLPTDQARLAITGLAESNLKIIRETLGVHICARQDKRQVQGDEHKYASNPNATL